MNNSDGPLFVFAVVREGDNVMGTITHLMCKDFDEDGFYGLKIVSVDDIRHIDDNSDPVMLVLCYSDIAMDIPYEHIIATGAVVYKTQYTMDSEVRPISVQKETLEGLEPETQGSMYLEEVRLANIQFMPTLPLSVATAMVEESDLDEPLQEEELYDEDDDDDI